MIYKFIIRPLLFLIPAETAHHISMSALKILGVIPGALSLCRIIFGIQNKNLEKVVAGIRFPNPVGLAAGFDKNAIAYKELSALGFGFIEIGTVTPKPQPGNPKPRLFRLPGDKAIINRMGFNNDGVEAVAERLKKNNGKVIIGGNIGKNKVTPNETAVNDYLTCFSQLYPLVDYFVVNISSPNTPGLRELQEKEPLLALLSSIQKLNHETKSPKPVFLKIAPDLTNGQADDIIDIVLKTELAGVIISNTTISRERLSTSPSEIELIGAGGLSGKPLMDKSTELLRYVASKSGKKFAIIASGGIHSAADALVKLNAGADLVQLYTGFIYEGPGLIKSINKAILNN